ncbi:hypothetical protein [Paludibacter sp. 221]|nr:hypothetical protein [Paludibacter sp. 221]
MEQSDVSDTACKRSAACGNNPLITLWLKARQRLSVLPFRQYL